MELVLLLRPQQQNLPSAEGAVALQQQQQQLLLRQEWMQGVPLSPTERVPLQAVGVVALVLAGFG